MSSKLIRAVRAWGVVVVFGALFFGGVNAAEAQTAGSFSTTWRTNNPGTSANNQITIPTTGTGYNYNIYWEEVGNPTNTGSSTGHTGNATVTFPGAGTYRVDITGDFPRIFFNNGGDRRKILTVEQWGTGVWTSMDRAFYGATNLTVPATDAPNLSLVTNMSRMFAYVSFMNDDMSHWDVSTVTNMFGVFESAYAFNQPLNTWDVGNVTNMESMFYSASAFNQPLDTWDVSQVQSFFAMFSSASAFNQPLNSWDVSSADTFSNMFDKADVFNQPLDTWEMGQALYVDYMFSGAEAFNQPLDGWDMSAVEIIDGMFSGAIAFNQPLLSWDLQSVTSPGWNLFTGSALSTANYSATLAGWAARSVIPSNLNLDRVGTYDDALPYCSTAADARSLLTGTYGWIFDDGGVTPCYTLTYTADTNGSLTGVTQQHVPVGTDGTAVTAVPASGYTFLQWSDASVSNPRQDTAVGSTVAVEAQFAQAAAPAENDDETSSGSGRGGATYIVSPLARHLMAAYPGVFTVEAFRRGRFTDAQTVTLLQEIVRLLTVLLQAETGRTSQ